MQTVLNNMLNDVRETVLRITILSLRSYIYYTEASCSSSELYHPSLYIHILIYSCSFVHLSLSLFSQLSVSDGICSFRTSSFYSDSESSIKLYDTEKFT